MRILILTHHFPPLNSIAGSRPYSWAKYWKESGCDIHVLTTRKVAKDGPLNYTPPDLSRAGVRITELNYPPHSTPGARSEPERGAGRAKQGASKPSFSSSFLSLMSDIRNVLLPLPIHKFLWIAPAVRYAANLYRTWPYDAIVSTFSPLAPHVIASLLKRRTGAFWAADYRDLLTGNPSGSPPRPFDAIQTRLEKAVLKQADLVTSISNPYTDNLTDLLGKPGVTIENGFDPDELPEKRGSLFPADGAIRMVYTGLLYPEFRDPSALFRAIREMRDSGRLSPRRLKVLFYGRRLGNYLPDLIEKYDVSDVVEVHPMVDRDASLAIQRDADVLLFFNWKTPAPGILTGKIFEYLYSGTPILSIGSSHENYVDELIETFGFGVAAGNSVETLRRILADLLEKKRLRFDPSPALLKRFHRKELARRMLKAIQDGMKPTEEGKQERR